MYQDKRNWQVRAGCKKSSANWDFGCNLLYLNLNVSVLPLEHLQHYVYRMVYKIILTDC